MIIHSSHKAKDYLYELRQALGSSTDFGIERFTGIVVGRFFCVTHHCSYEWEYKYTCQKNTAIGIVRDSADGSIVRFVKTAGQLRPQFLLPAYIIFTFISIVFIGNMKFSALFSALMTILAIETAIVEPLTSAGKEGKSSLISLLQNPQNPYENL